MFVAGLQERMRPWWISLKEYRQIQVKEDSSLDLPFSIIYIEFVGSVDDYLNQVREEYLNMKRCFFQKKNLEIHYDRMCKKFYVLNSVDDVNF